MKDSIFKLMAFYLLHRNWRARISTNEAVSWIWTLWVLGAMQGLGAIYVSVAAFDKHAAILAGGALLAFAASAFFAPAAKRKHATLVRIGNPILFGRHSEED